MNNEEFIKKLYKIHGNLYDPLEKYTSYHTKMKVKRTSCNHILEITPGNLYNLKSCPKCNNLSSSRRSIEDFKDDVYKLVGNEYTVISDTYVNNKTKVKIRHNVCNNVYEVRPNDFNSRGRRCPICSNKNRNKDKVNWNLLDDLINHSKDGKEYKWLEDYKGSNKKKHKIKHITCGHIYEVRPNDFQQGYRCPICSNPESTNETFIKTYLDLMEIKYEREKTFPLCKNIRSLPFDFYLKDYNAIIEYDGQQHFYESWEDVFEYTKNNDKIKNLYLKDTDISMIRLNYKMNKYVIIEILNHYLYHNKLTNDMIKKYKIYYKKNNRIYNEKTYYTNINKNYFK